MKDTPNLPMKRTFTYHAKLPIHPLLFRTDLILLDMQNNSKTVLYLPKRNTVSYHAELPYYSLLKV